MKKIVDSSVEHGLKVPAVRATMLAGFFSGGVGIYVFYALQPICCNSGAIRRLTASPAWSRRSSLAPRSSAACSRPNSWRCSGGVRRLC